MRSVADMTTVILPWFPIVLSAAIGSRLVDRSRASWLGGACALYFIILVQMSTGVPIWADAASGAALLAGAAAILGIAEWSSRNGEAARSEDGVVEQADSEVASLAKLGDAMAAFDCWLEANRSGADVWAAFDEFLRAQLYEHCDAMHVRTYRILSEGDRMVPLHAINDEDMDHLVSARKGVAGYVATTGRSYVAGDAARGELVRVLANRTVTPPQWCFGIRQGPRMIGVVSVGTWGTSRHVRSDEPDALRAWELLIAHFWVTLGEVYRGRSAVTTDAVSQLMTRGAFLEEAQHAVAISRDRGEPVAICVVAIEGLRALQDCGRWEQSDELVVEVARTIREHVRPDDLLGRFDDGRLMLMMRCVDSDLASLIVTQLTARLASLPIAASLSDAAVGVRCGVAGSGTETRSVVQLVASAVALCNSARTRAVPVETDLPGVGVVTDGAPSGHGATA